MFYSSIVFRPGKIHKVSESQHEEVYGATFAEYTDEQFEEFLQPLLHRLSANGVKPDEDHLRVTMRKRRMMIQTFGVVKGSVQA